MNQADNIMLLVDEYANVKAEYEEAVVFDLCLREREKRMEEARQTLRAAIEQAILNEREQCAKVCDEQHDRARTSTGAARADACAAAIRQLKESK